MNPAPKKIQRVLVLGGGSAGLIAAHTLKKKLPQMEVEVLRSPEIGVIGVGEGTTAAFPRHFFEYLKMDPQSFYEGADPTWKLGIRFIWGPKEFNYTFSREYSQRWTGMLRNTGFYVEPETSYVGITSACMARDRAFPRKQDGTPHIHNNHAFHIENTKLVGWLEKQCLAERVTITDGTMAEAEVVDGEIAGLKLTDGRRVTADLYVDASGFRSELLGRALGTPHIDYTKSLFCDRAVIAGWPRTDEPIKPYTVAETMDSGWCWQIEHEHWINRGYVYASAFISDEEALREFRTKNPKIANEPRVVKFRSGRYKDHWVGNVVGVGNSVGFVEPLEATALQVVCVEASTLADTLMDSMGEPTPTLKKLYNKYNSAGWDDIRDFLAVHYKFNTRLDTPFWQACRNDTDLAGAQQVVEFYQENGPSVVAADSMLHPSNSFGIEGYLVMMTGQRVPHGKPYQATDRERKLWRDRLAAFDSHAKAAASVEDTLKYIRRPGAVWSSGGTM